MSKREIELALQERGLKAKYLEFSRDIPTPEERLSGWTIYLDAQSEERLEARGEDPEIPHLRNTVDALAWIGGLPDCRQPVAAAI